MAPGAGSGTDDAPTKHRPFPALSSSRWLALVLTVLAIVFIAQNRDSVSVDLLWISVESPLWFILVVLLAVGWIVGALTVRGRGKRKASDSR